MTYQIKNCVKEIKSWKEGPDKISPEVLKALGQKLLQTSSSAFCRELETEVIPEE
jgi:hypothetical protein